MNTLPKIILISSLFILTMQTAWSESADAYMDALSKEAGHTKMRAEAGVTIVDDEPEPSDIPEQKVDNDKLANKVSLQLEKLLTGSSSEDIKQEDLANIVSSAVQDGHKIDNIQDAVSNAMSVLREKKSLDIKPEVLEFSAHAVNEIVGASKDVATGNADDPYINSLKNYTVKENKKNTNTTKTADTSDSASSPTQTDKTEVKITSDSTTPPKVAEDKSQSAMRTIVVLQGESLSRIANKIYGSKSKYILLYKANKDTLKDHNIIRAGQILKVPPLPKK
jgi:LysM repeat protein